MPLPKLHKPEMDANSGSNGPRRVRFPRIDYVTLMVIAVILILVLYFTSELWLTHLFNNE